MPREKCLECHNAIVIRLLNSSMERLVQVAGIVRIAVAVCNDTRVHARAVAVPDLEEGCGDRFACIHIDDLDVECQRYALLVIGDISTDKFALNPVGALSHLGTEDATIVAGEEKARVRIYSNAGKVAVVIGVDDAVEITSTEIRLVCLKCKYSFFPSLWETYQS
jgi:hypothetical protein